MEWLTLEEATAQNFRVRGSPPQYLEFPADLKRLPAEIPTAPHFEKSGLIPGPSYQWYGRSGDRLLILECEQEPQGNEGRAFVHTSYLQRQDQLGDWSVLMELSDLPSAICVNEAHFHPEPEHVAGVGRLSLQSCWMELCCLQRIFAPRCRMPALFY